MVVLIDLENNVLILFRNIATLNLTSTKCSSRRASVSQHISVSRTLRPVTTGPFGRGAV